MPDRAVPNSCVEARAAADAALQCGGEGDADRAVAEADEALREAMASADLEGLKTAINRLAAVASSATLQAARKQRDALKEKAKKAAQQQRRSAEAAAAAAAAAEAAEAAALQVLQRLMSAESAEALAAALSGAEAHTRVLPALDEEIPQARARQARLLEEARASSKARHIAEHQLRFEGLSIDHALAATSAATSNPEAATPAVAADVEAHLPPEYYCPITTEPMQDPVVTCDGACAAHRCVSPSRDHVYVHMASSLLFCTSGQTYERAAIEQWLRDNETSPLTGQTLQNKVVIPCVALRSAIRRELALA